MLRSHSHKVLEVCTGEAGPSTGRRGLVQRQGCRRGVNTCSPNGKPSSPAAARRAMRPKRKNVFVRVSSIIRVECKTESSSVFSPFDTADVSVYRSVLGPSPSGLNSTTQSPPHLSLVEAGCL
jgi:hypothetical protein